jgi:hypothetical protein
MVRLWSAVLVSATAFAAWPRHLTCPKCASDDSPPPHPLAYFQVDPCSRPDGDALVRDIECTWLGKAPPSKEELALRAKTTTRLAELGKIGDFTVYDFWYSREASNHDSYYGDMRSVLVQTGEDEYREIDVKTRYGPGDPFPPSEVIDLDGEPVLIIKYHDGGNHTWIETRVLLLRQSGPEKADFREIGDAVSQLTPAGMSGLRADDDFPSMTYSEMVYRPETYDPGHGVMEGGRITITYRFHGGRAVVTTSKYEPFPR